MEYNTLNPHLRLEISFLVIPSNRELEFRLPRLEQLVDKGAVPRTVVLRQDLYSIYAKELRPRRSSVPHRLYMEEMDLLRWSLLKAFGRLAALEGTPECIWFKPYIAVWREELGLRLKAKALANIRSVSLTGIQIVL